MPLGNCLRTDDFVKFSIVDEVQFSHNFTITPLSESGFKNMC